MPRIIVVSDSGPDTDKPFFNERVDVMHLEDEHCADQITERLVWAVHDAQEAQQKFAEGIGVKGYREVPAS